MRVSVIVVGIGQWDMYTAPYIESLREHEPGASLVVVDNGSDTEYPESAVRLDKTVSYAAAINAGLGRCKLSDWYIVSNNDVLCQGGFIEALARMDETALYGNRLHKNDVSDIYIDGWIYFIPLRVRLRLGRFDEEFKIAAYEDIDYSKRAADAGIELIKADLPFVHLEERSRYRAPDYDMVYEENRKYFMVKHGLG